MTDVARKDEYLDAAIAEARKGLAAGGIPIGSVLVLDGKIVGRGHNQRVQKGSAVLHAEMDCLENAGRLTAADYARATLYSTLSPCDMCSGAILLYKIPRVVIGEHRRRIGGQLLRCDLEPAPDLGRLEAKTLELNREPVDVRALLAAIASTIVPAANRRNVTI